MGKSNANHFVDYLFKEEIIQFGEFELKSGRMSPYFFNFGSFNDSMKLISLGSFYANCIIEKELEFDVLFGPAYKGIPIGISTAIALSTIHNKNVNFAFNRKEKKPYGDGGNIVGTSLHGKRVLAIDDVITSGKTIKETKDIIENEGGTLSSFVVALDRSEKSITSDLSALKEASSKYNVKIIAVADIWNIIQYIDENYGQSFPHYKSINDYLEIYGCRGLTK